MILSALSKFQSAAGPKASGNLPKARPKAWDHNVRESAAGPKASGNPTLQLLSMTRVLFQSAAGPKASGNSSTTKCRRRAFLFQSAAGPKASGNDAVTVADFDHFGFNPPPARRPAETCSTAPAG